MFKDHYVPQLLLRGFAPGKRNLLYVFDKRTGQTFRSSVRDAGCGRGFYEPRREPAVNVDEWMKQVETEAVKGVGIIFPIERFTDGEKRTGTRIN